MSPQVSMQICRGASTLENMLGLLFYESSKLDFYCERVNDTLIVWPKLFGQVNGIQNLEDTSVCIYAPIEVTSGIYKTSLWPLEVLQHIESFIAQVNPNTRKVYGLFNMKAHMPTFLQSKHYKVLRIGVCVTEGLLLSPAFKAPPGLQTFKSTEVLLNCHPDVSKQLWESLNTILLSKDVKRSGDLRVILCIQKKLWWEMKLKMFFDLSEIDQVTAVFREMSLSWTESVVKYEASCMDTNSKILTTINRGLANNYALTSEHSCVREMSDLPNAFNADMFQSATCGFGQDVAMIGIPLPCLAHPISDIVLTEFLGEEDFWQFLKCTTSERNMDKFDVFGIVLSAVLSKV